MESTKLFGTTPPVKLFFIVAVPGMISMLAASIYSVVEGVFIGQILGETAFAAINIAMPLVMINFSLADMMGVGSSVPISIALGRKDNESANNLFTCGLCLIFMSSLSMGIMMYFGAPVFVELMGAEGNLAIFAMKYVRTYAVLGPVTTIVFAMDNYLRICGFVRGSMLLNILMTILTIGFLYLLLGVVGMNVEGSALASCGAMFICACIAITPFLMRKTLLKLVKPKFSFALIKQIISCGMPTFLNNIAGRLASIIMNMALLRVGGETAVAAYSVLMYASDIIQPMLYGMSDSLQPAIGYNWGAGSLTRVRDIAKCSFTACAVVSFIGTAVMYFMPDAISNLFVKAGDIELLEMSIHGMKLFCLAYLFRWFGFAVQGFFGAIEKPIPASILSVSSAMILPILFVFVLLPWGLDGLWLNLTATSLVVSVMAFFLLLKEQKQMKHQLRIE